MKSTEPSSTVGISEARTHFYELLARVEDGQEVTITRHGTPVVKLVPVLNRSTHQDRRRAIAAIRKLAAENRLRGLKIKDLIAEGR